MYWIQTLRHWATLNSSRIYLEHFLRRAAQQLAPGSRVLDAGAGDCRYAHLFRHTDYLAVDFAQVDKPYGPLDVIADLLQLPFPESYFDAIICTQVLEHLPRPQAALVEFHRLLRPGGMLWLTAPLYYAEHEIPFDFYRYTRFGLAFLLEEAGFTVQRLEWLEGYWGTLSYQWRSAAYELPWILPPGYGPMAIRLLSGIILPAVKAILAAGGITATYLDLQQRDTSRWHCKNYCLEACKGASNVR
ncbi:MAG: class I SAM-dependent methyltransferase [Chloroflexi bacterium]|nr:MAG: class I SAM-dependent methyltransferase [Chloroflexota bacterium]